MVMHQAASPDKPSSSALSSIDGTLLGLLTAGFYSLFTLLPGSSTFMVAWPWVFLWQVGLVLPILWLLWQVALKPLCQLALGNRLDWIVALTCLGLVVSTAAAEFPQQARWYSWMAVGGLAALYAVNGWLSSVRRQRQLLQFQGGLALAFIGLSLGLWLAQIYLPELARLNVLQQYGIDARFSFQFTSLRNWQPIGHQNYVAGYLVLVLPLLAALTWMSKGWQRWVWLAGGALGLVDLYTTSSRGGWLGLIAMAVVGFAVALLRSALPRRLLLLLGSLGLGALVIAIATNDRLSQVAQALAQGKVGGELSYRLITNTVGWNMGAARPWSGLGLGSVPLVYQQYRPYWAGRDAELQYQLHSTPAQLWGELGVWGIGVPLLLLIALVLLTGRWLRQPRAMETAGAPAETLPAAFVWALLGGLFAYSIVSLTDYQLDNLCISGVVLLYLAVLARTWHPQPAATEQRPARLNRALAGVGIGLTLATTLWLVPIHRAWSLSSEGFAALQKGNIGVFVQALTQAHNLAPWEPYYAAQLAWNLGDLSYQSQDPQQSAALRESAIDWFETANAISPYQEFGHSNLGWLQIGANQPESAIASFTRSSRLVPAKQGVFFGLGFSLLLSDQPELAAAAFALEILRNPALVTSPLWKLHQFQPVYRQVLDQVESYSSKMLTQTAARSSLSNHLHQIRGGVYWWQGDLAQAEQDWKISSSAASQAILTLAQNQPLDLENLPPASPEKLALQAWLAPAQRRSLLEQAWIAQPEDLPQLDEILPPADILDQLETSLNQSPSLDSWLKDAAPSWQPRSQRLGFGIISRHIDGPQPSDYFPRIENIPMVKFFSTVFPGEIYLPELDRQLEPLRQQLLSQVEQLPRPNEG